MVNWCLKSYKGILIEMLIFLITLYGQYQTFTEKSLQILRC